MYLELGLLVIPIFPITVLWPGTMSFRSLFRLILLSTYVINCFHYDPKFIRVDGLWIMCVVGNILVCPQPFCRLQCLINYAVSVK